MSEPTVFVVGNEAGDVDSIVSSLLVAHFLHELNPLQDFQAVLPFPRSDFRLRRDAIELFRFAGFEFDQNEVPFNLVFLNEVDLNHARVILTDCNKIGSHLLPYHVQIVGIFDHHRDEALFPHLPFGRILDETAGSCCSVILAHFSTTQQVPSALQQLALGCILLDTHNFSIPSRHAPVDLGVVNTLVHRLPTTIDLVALHTMLLHARNDVTHLTMDELFLLDYKQDVALGFATLLVSVPFVFGRLDQVRASMHDLLLRNKLDLLCALTSAEHNERGFFLYSVNPTLGRTVVSNLVNNDFSPSFFNLPLCKVQEIPQFGFGFKSKPPSPPLGLNPPYFVSGTVFGRITRKTMMPAIAELLAKTKTVL